MAVLLFMMVLGLPSFPSVAVEEGPAARMDIPGLWVEKEWESDWIDGAMGGSLDDSNGDGLKEMIAWGNCRSQNGSVVQRVLLFDLVNRSLLGTADFGSSISSPSVVGDPASPQLLVMETTETSFNYTLLSGRDLRLLWRSPDFGGELVDQDISDVDADGKQELVSINTTISNYSPYLEWRSQLHILELAGHYVEWSSPVMERDVNGMDLVALDNDAAQEILLQTNTEGGVSNAYSVRVYDGASHGLQWKVPENQNITSIFVNHIGDIDNDASAEVILVMEENVAYGVYRSSFHVLYGGNGTEKWNATLGSHTSLSPADIDGDRVQELLCRSMNNGYGTINYSIIDPVTRTEVWHLGPFPYAATSPGGFYPMDVSGDGVPEVVLANYSREYSNQSAAFDIFGGKDLRKLWDSPTFRSAYTWIEAAQLDSDAPWEIYITESWTDSALIEHGYIHIYSGSDFSAEWNSPDYGSSILVWAEDAAGDAKSELLVREVRNDFSKSTRQCWLHIIDGETHATRFISPVCTYMFSYSFADVFGSPLNETIFNGYNVSANWSDSSGFVSVFDGTDFTKLWETAPDQTVYAFGAGDLDGDSQKEIIVEEARANETNDYWSKIVLWEFLAEPPGRPDLSVSDGDLILSNATPYDGQAVNLSATVRNLGTKNASACCLTFSVDGVVLTEARFDIVAGLSTEVFFNWTATLGTHVLGVKADPGDILPEANETNNNATLRIMVYPRPRPVPVITSPREGQAFEEGAQLTLDGTRSLSPTGDALRYSWRGNSTGHLGSDALVVIALPPGAHRINLNVDDGHYNESATVNISVSSQAAPGTTRAVIASPGNWTVFTAGQLIRFDGTRSVPAKPEYVLTHNWSSNISGVLGLSANFSRSLPAGSHRIILTVDDGHGGQASAWVAIEVSGMAGVAAIITSPVDGQEFEDSQPITFDGSDSSGPSGAVLSYVWTSNATGIIGNEGRFVRKLSAGYHNIVLQASDGQGHAGQTSVNISVKRSADLPPSIAILNPAEGAVVSGIVNVSGTAVDDLEVVSVSIRIDNGTWQAVNGTTRWSCLWNTSTVSNGTHRVTVRAADRARYSPEVAVDITVDNRPSNPPEPVRNPKKDELPLAAILGVLLAVVILVGIAAVLLRKRPPSTAGASPSETLPPAESPGVPPPTAPPGA